MQVAYYAAQDGETTRASPSPLGPRVASGVFRARMDRRLALGELRSAQLSLATKACEWPAPSS